MLRTALVRSALRRPAAATHLLHRRCLACAVEERRYPTAEECKTQVRHYHEMSGDILLLLASRGDRGACRERLVRDVMHVDELSWPEASARVDEMDESVQAPAVHRITGGTILGMSLLAGAASVPLVFDLDTAMWFNEFYVTADVPPDKDLETWLEVGMWTWNWMEPPIGTISFVLLCLQMARGRGLSNPVARVLQSRRERYLLERYPRYSPLILLQWADSDLRADLSGGKTSV